MDIPMDIVSRRRNRRRIAVPQNIIGNNKDLPGSILIKYTDTIEVEKVDNIVRHKYNILKQQNKNTSSFDKYFDISSKLISDYNQTNNDVVLQKFIDLVNNYIKIECIKIETPQIYCSGCGEAIGDFGEENTYVCDKCSCVNSFLHPNNYNKITERYTNHTDEETGNFIKVLDKFEGKSEQIPPEELYEELDEYMESMNEQKGEYYRSLPVDEYGKKPGTSKRKLWSLLESTKNNRYYDESNYIAHKYWGWELPDISKYREQLINDYIRTQEIWRKIKYKYNRSASLGTQFRLYVHLKAIGYECSREDFKIQEMVDSLRIHNDAWETMCKETGLKYTFVS